MTAVEIGEVVLVVFCVMGWATSWDVRRLSTAYPDIRSLQERKRVSYAITLEMTLIVGLIIAARWFQVSLGRDLNTVLFLVALGAPSLVNAAWLAPTVRRVLARAGQKLRAMK